MKEKRLVFKKGKPDAMKKADQHVFNQLQTFAEDNKLGENVKGKESENEAPSPEAVAGAEAELGAAQAYVEDQENTLNALTARLVGKKMAKAPIDEAKAAKAAAESSTVAMGKLTEKLVGTDMTQAEPAALKVEAGAENIPYDMDGARKLIRRALRKVPREMKTTSRMIRRDLKDLSGPEGAAILEAVVQNLDDLVEPDGFALQSFERDLQVYLRGGELPGLASNIDLSKSQYALNKKKEDLDQA
jgi:hypothetical protein